MKKNNTAITRNEDLVKKIFVNTVSITRVNETGNQTYELRRIGGAFELKKLDEITDTELGVWYFGEIAETRSGKRFAVLEKRGNKLFTVSRAYNLVETLNQINNIIEEGEYPVRITMENLARLIQI